MKMVGKKNPLAISATIFFGREQEQEHKSRMEKWINRYYGISEIEYFNQEYADYDRESRTWNGNAAINGHFKRFLNDNDTLPETGNSPCA